MMSNTTGFKIGAGRISNYSKKRLQFLNENFPVGSRCRYTNSDGTDEIVTVASPFCLIDGEPMGLFKEKTTWHRARVRELPPESQKRSLYS